MLIADANIILRYLLGDVPEMRMKSAEVLDGDEYVLVLNEVFAEVVYVLEGIYNVKRELIATTLSAFLNKPQIISRSSELMFSALNYFAEYKIDFVDSILLAHSLVQDNSIITFDKKLLSLINKLQKK